jgi:tellurite resistance protein TerC
VRQVDGASGKLATFVTPLFLCLVLVLIFVGAKIFLVGIVGKFPPLFSLSVTTGLIGGGILYSLWRTRQIAPTFGGKSSP